MKNKNCPLFSFKIFIALVTLILVSCLGEDKEISLTGTDGQNEAIINPEYEDSVKKKLSDVCDPSRYTMRGPESGCTFDSGLEPPKFKDYVFSLRNSVSLPIAFVTWQYSKPNSTWHTFDYTTSNESAILSNKNFLQEGTYNVKAIISGCNGKTITKSMEIIQCSGDNHDDNPEYGKEENTPTCVINTSVAELSFPENGGTKNFTLTGITYSSITDNRGWINTNRSGGIVTVTCSAFTGNPNTASDSDKTGIITVTGNSGCEDTVMVSRTISVSDQGADRDCDEEGC
ncbi:MAG: hypothetical protein AAF600_14995 [Bacteroidota bacterium]